MSDFTSAPPPLGIGAIISESITIFFRRIVPIFLIGFIVYFVVQLALGIVFGFDVVTGTAPGMGMDDPADFDPQDFEPMGVGSMIGGLLAGVLPLLAQGLVTSAVVLLAYDARLGRPVRMAGYIGAALPVVPTVFVLTILISLMIALGFVALIVPGLWIAAVFSVAIPAVVIERAGFGALTRSIDLTRGYRWSIVGLYVVMFLIAIVASIILGGLLLSIVGTIVGVGNDAVGFVGGVLLVIADAVTQALSFGFTAVMAALLYARLREIKEGVGVDSLADVFR